MNVDEALRQFAESDGLPRQAMAWALENWQAASPRFMARLRAYAGGGDRTEAAERQVFYIVHLSGQMREPRAYEPLCRLIADDPDLEDCLGDAVTETLPGVLINVFDGDPAPLLGAIEATGAYEAARGSALSALGYLVRTKRALDDDTMRALLRRWRRDAEPRDILSFWFAWAGTAAALGYEDLKMDLAVLNKEGIIGAREFGLEDFEEILKFDARRSGGARRVRRSGRAPLDDAIARLEIWGYGDGRRSRRRHVRATRRHAARKRRSFDAPYLNPFRNVGRNDPCPCGSGKKYKKCCLAS